MAQYINDYVDYFNVRQHIRFNTRVTRLARASAATNGEPEARWIVSTVRQQCFFVCAPGGAARSKTTVASHVCRALLVVNNRKRPMVPSLCTLHET